jgi:hypothetical protein
MALWLVVLILFPFHPSLKIQICTATSLKIHLHCNSVIFLGHPGFVPAPAINKWYPKGVQCPKSCWSFTLEGPGPQRVGFPKGLEF